MTALSDSDFRLYDRMAQHMDKFHDHIRANWRTLYEACASGKRSPGMSIRSFLLLGLEFCRFLHMHHSIEEHHLFPILAARMPAFRADGYLEGQHHQMLGGLSRFEEYLEACERGEKDLKLSELKDIMDSFGDVMMTHLDEEVKELGAENMRKYWSKEDMRTKFPI